MYLFIGILMSISCPIPAGIVAPSIFLGAVIGKLYGELAFNYFNFMGIEHISVCGKWKKNK